MNTLKPNCKNLPNPAKLMESLRSTGYDNYHAIADIVDNSIDAEASNIWIEIHLENKDFVIRIIDDGRGMNDKILDEALKLGSDVEKDFATDLGRFGMGLVTASLSMSKRITVITKQKENNMLMGILDLDWIKEQNDFIKYQSEADSDKDALFKEVLKNSDQGTIVILSKGDKIQNTNVSVFRNTLRNHIGRIFRRFIEAGKNFYINGEKVHFIDPLMLAEKNTQVYSDETYPIKIKSDMGEIEDSIRIRMVIVPDYGVADNKERGINLQNQGFYVMRNEREILDGNSLGVYTRDPHLNRFRSELCFTGALDNLMGVHFTKRSLSIEQSLADKIKEIVRSQIRQIQNIADLQRPSKEKEVSHLESEKLISKKSKLLIKPPIEQISKKKNGKEKTKEQKPEQGSEKKEKNPIERLRLICRFEEANMDRVGPLYSPYMEGSKVVIRWNADHPFYENILVHKKEDKTFLTAIDFLVYSLACAELKARSEENVALLEEMRTFMSTNLRVLLD